MTHARHIMEIRGTCICKPSNVYFHRSGVGEVTILEDFEEPGVIVAIDRSSIVLKADDTVPCNWALPKRGWYINKDIETNDGVITFPLAFEWKEKCEGLAEDGSDPDYEPGEADTIDQEFANNTDQPDATQEFNVPSSNSTTTSNPPSFDVSQQNVDTSASEADTSRQNDNTATTPGNGSSNAEEDSPMPVQAAENATNATPGNQSANDTTTDTTDKAETSSASLSETGVNILPNMRREISVPLKEYA